MVLMYVRALVLLLAIAMVPRKAPSTVLQSACAMAPETARATAP